VRVGENGVVALPAAGLLARVITGAGSLDRVGHELAVGRWLDFEGIPLRQVHRRVRQVPRHAAPVRRRGNISDAAQSRCPVGIGFSVNSYL
jgi:hypothetical protein